MQCNTKALRMFVIINSYCSILKKKQLMLYWEEEYFHFHPHLPPFSNLLIISEVETILS